MPAVSDKQRRFMGRVMAYKEGDRKGAGLQVRKAASSMNDQEVRDFTRTVRKGSRKGRR